MLEFPAPGVAHKTTITTSNTQLWTHNIGRLPWERESCQNCTHTPLLMQQGTYVAPPPPIVLQQDISLISLYYHCFIPESSQTITSFVNCFDNVIDMNGIYIYLNKLTFKKLLLTCGCTGEYQETAYRRFKGWNCNADMYHEPNVPCVMNQNITVPLYFYYFIWCRGLTLDCCPECLGLQL